MTQTLYDFISAEMAQSQQQPGMAQQILSKRFEPNLQDASRASLQNFQSMAYGKPSSLSGQDFADQRLTQAMKLQKEQTGNAPAVLQVNDAIQKALDAGDYDTANRIAWLQRSQAYGVNTFSAPGGTALPGNPQQYTPFTPQQPGAPMAPTAPAAQPMAPPSNAGGMSIAQQIAQNAARKKGAETQAQKDVELNMNPQITRATEIEKIKGAKEAELGERAATMPQLKATVDRLSELGKQATYTYAGQVIDFLGRQAGLEPRDAAVARKEYISLVSNQILPLLRQTFGAQFTQQEGESLKVTLGDPNATPEEKDAVLRSFIDQKKQTINSIERELGLPVTQWETGEQIILPNEVNDSPAAIDYREYFK